MEEFINTMKNNYYICAIIKNEQLYLKEWIEYHLSLGFNYIYLFEDFGSESHQDIIKEFADKVILTKCEDYFTIKRDYDNGGSRQRRVYSKFLYEHHEMGWCAFIDIDEFMVFNDGYTLDKICSEYNDVAGVCMFWKMFNANGHIIRPVGNVFEKYTEETGYLAQDLGWCYKSLVNMNIAKRFNNQHMISDLVDINRNKIKEKDKNLKVCFDKIQLNHYYTKSVEDWLYRFKNKGDLVINHRKFNSFYYQNPDLLWISDYIDETSDISDLKNKTSWQYNEDILITIGMPNYNGEKYIREAIDSCLNQTYKNFELLIVDDGSTDNSIDIIESYNDLRIRLIKNSHDFIDTRNKILNLSNGKYIALLDSDDIMNPDRLEYQIKYMENNQSVDMCYTQCESVNDKYDFELYDRDILKPITYKEMLKNNYVFQNTVMIRKSTIEKYNLQYDKELIYIEDYKLWLDMLSYNCIIMELPKKLVKYRVHDNNCIVTKKELIDKKKKELIDNYKNNLKNILIYDIGAYDGKDSKYLLDNGFSVVSVECNPDSINICKYKLKDYTNSIFIDKCVYNIDNTIKTFYSSVEELDWSSLYKSIANRDNKNIKEYNVSTIRLDTLIKQYGIPKYLKIDIEGYDYDALCQLKTLNKLPDYISAESECLNDNDKYENEEFKVLNILKELGYTKFKLIKQESNNSILLPWNIIKWNTYNEIYNFIKNKSYLYRIKNNYGFWFDIYATK